MKVEVLRSRLRPLFQQIVGETDISCIEDKQDWASWNEELQESTAQSQKQLKEQNRTKGILEKIVQKLLLKKYQHQLKTPPVYKASLFPDGKTSVAALSLVCVASLKSYPKKWHEGRR